MRGDLAPMRRAPVLKQIDALPGSETQPALDQRNRQIDAGQSRADMGRHVVGTLVIVGVARRVFRRDAVEKSLEVRANLRRRVS